MTIKGYFTLIKVLELDLHNDMQFSVILNHFFFSFGGVLPHFRAYTQCILNAKTNIKHKIFLINTITNKQERDLTHLNINKGWVLVDRVLDNCIVVSNLKLQSHNYVHFRTNCCGPVKGRKERHELGITWNKHIERKYKYSRGKRVLNVSLTAKVSDWSWHRDEYSSGIHSYRRSPL